MNVLNDECKINWLDHRISSWIVSNSNEYKRKKKQLNKIYKHKHICKQTKQSKRASDLNFICKLLKKKPNRVK
jgi:hypothetical protein